MRSDIVYYFTHLSLGDVFDLLSYIGLAVLVIRLVFFRKTPIVHSKKVPREMLDYCVQTLQKQDKREYSTYIVPGDILEDLKTDIYKETTLRRLLCSVCDHVGLNGNYVKLVVKDVFESERAGQISADLLFTTINLDIKKYYTPDVIIAVMAHEVMHLHMYYLGIRYNDTWENEVLTDTMTVYCGFGEYMYRGYAVIPGNFALSYSKVGYIGQNDIEYLETLLSKYRNG